MRIIDSKRNEFGSKTFVVLTCNSIYMIETIGGVTPLSLRTPEIVFKKEFKKEIPGCVGSICAGSLRSSFRTRVMCLGLARRAMRLHK